MTTARVRHCVECPKCLTRYLVGFSPYRNGSYLMPLSAGFSEEWTLYCSCGRPPISSRWNLERAEAICGFESSSLSRLWGTRGDGAGLQEVAVFGLGLSLDISTDKRGSRK